MVVTRRSAGASARDPAPPVAADHPDDVAFASQGSPWTLRTLSVLAIPLLVLPLLWTALLLTMPNLQVTPRLPLRLRARSIDPAWEGAGRHCAHARALIDGSGESLAAFPRRPGSPFLRTAAAARPSQDRGIPQAAWAAIKPPHDVAEIRHLRDSLADFAEDHPVRRQSFSRAL